MIPAGRDDRRGTLGKHGQVSCSWDPDVVFLRRLPREAGLPTARQEESAEPIDLANSPAFAMGDHQFAQVLDNEPEVRTTSYCGEIFRSTGIKRIRPKLLGQR